jgi:uncharacterized YigZ family protein
MKSMQVPLSIKTLKNENQLSYKEKGSEFIAKAFPVKNENEILCILDKTKKEYYDASHHCYAFRLKDNLFRYSDAGEPNGTAGIRILNAIDHFALTDILVIIVRYFGGVKLGAGLLGKTYYRSSELVLEKCEWQEEKAYNTIIINANFNFIGSIHRTLSKYSGIINNTEYLEEVRLNCLVPVNYTTEIENELRDSVSGKITLSVDHNIVYHT